MSKKLNRLEFLRAVVRDFKSFSGKHELNLERAIGLHYMMGENKAEPRLGSNGSGKSTIWDAICWCLFGRTASGLKNPDVMPWSGKGIPIVILEIAVNGRLYGIERHATKPMILRINGEDVGQEKVVALLRMDFDIATNTILIGQGQDLFFDRPAPLKLALFHDALNLDRWDDRSKLASEGAREREQELAKFQGEAQGLEGSLASLNKVLEEANNNSKAWEREREIARKTSELDLVKMRNDIEDLQRKIDAADLAYDGCRAEVKALESHCERDSNALRNAQVDLQRVTDRRKQVDKLATALEITLGDKRQAIRCPTCGNALGKGDLHDHLEKIQAEIDALDEEWKSLDPKPYQQIVDGLDKALSTAQAFLRDFRQRSQSHLDMLQRWRPDMVGLKANLKHAEIARKSSEEDKNPFASQARALKKAGDKYEANLADCKADIEQVEKELAREKVWVKGFKDIKLHVVDEILQELQLVTDGMLEDIGLVGWRVNYVIETETQKGGAHRGLQVLISSPKSTRKVRWESWSGGEGQRLRIVGTFALSEVLLNYAGVNPDLEVLDEPAQYFSGEGIHDLCSYLAERAQGTKKRIWYVDHASRDSAQFASTLSIIRDKAGSRIAGEGGA